MPLPETRRLRALFFNLFLGAPFKSDESDPRFFESPPHLFICVESLLAGGRRTPGQFYVTHWDRGLEIGVNKLVPDMVADWVCLFLGIGPSFPLTTMKMKGGTDSTKNDTPVWQPCLMAREPPKLVTGIRS